MALALANPGAHIVGIDIAPKSVELAKRRIEYHGIPNSVEFHCLPVEELTSLPYTFDYINCDETLYLLPDPEAGLQAMKSVLNPEGIIRANLHSAFQRTGCYRMQALFKQFGCLEGDLTNEEIEVVRQTMGALQDWVLSKQQLWNHNPDLQTNPEKVMANFLLRGDKGYTMQDFSALLRGAGLSFISMVNWREWDLEKLFKSIEDLPIAVALGLAEMSLEEQLYVCELLHPVHRLLDLYCGHPGQEKVRSPLAEWSMEQWNSAKIHLHPQLRTPHFGQLLAKAAQGAGMLALHKHLPIANQKFELDSNLVGTLYGLMDGAKSLPELGDRWRQIHPVDPITLKPISSEQVMPMMRNVLTQLESAGYLLIELA